MAGGMTVSTYLLSVICTLTMVAAVTVLQGIGVPDGSSRFSSLPAPSATLYLAQMD